MRKTITARYDGRAIQPDEPLPLPRGTRLTITWQAEDPQPSEDKDVGATTFFTVARSLSIEGPTDWSARIDHYLYGVDDDKPELLVEMSSITVGADPGQGQFRATSTTHLPAE